MATASIAEEDVIVDEHTKAPFLRRVRIRGYKSIAFCDVALQPLTILVGRNGAGKSNFLDALKFLRDIMALGVNAAVTRHGGWSAITCQSSAVKEIEIEIQASFTNKNSSLANGPSTEAGIGRLGESFAACYSLTLATNEFSVPMILRESLEILDGFKHRIVGFSIRSGTLDPSAPKPEPEWIAALLQHRQIPGGGDSPMLGPSGVGPSSADFFWAELRHMVFYNLDLEEIRRPQRLHSGSFLEQNAWNLASVIASTRKCRAWAFERLSSYLSAVVPEVNRFQEIRYGDYQTVRFWLDSGDADKPLEFDAANLSDGTLRALACLTAAFQYVLPYGHPSLVAIEEPETALHPAAMQVLVDALDESTQHTQVLLTTHSADLLDGRDLTPCQVLVVRNRDGKTLITPMNSASREIIEDELYSLADLHRLDQLDLNEADLSRQTRLNEKAKGA
jgi:predicted ATPase